jgi:hypothetical protein
MSVSWFSRLQSYVWLLRLLAKRPQEFVDGLVERVEYGLDPLFAHRPAYEAMDWANAQEALDVIFPGSATILTEQSLLEIETEVIRRRDELTCGGPWDLRFDADLALARCLYIVCRAIHPSTIVETGVAYGLSSAFILQALKVNGHGELYSIDLPLPASRVDDFVGALIPDDLKFRWQLHRGASRRELPRLLRGRTLDLFVHDSSHTYWNMRREFELAWQHLRPSGVLVADDIDGNQAFNELRPWHPGFWKPVRQESKQAFFGVAVKSPFQEWDSKTGSIDKLLEDSMHN